MKENLKISPTFLKTIIHPVRLFYQNFEKSVGQCRRQPLKLYV